MKRFTKLMLLLTLTTMMYAQPGAPAPKTAEPVAVTGSNKDVIELAATKLENLTLKNKQLIADANSYQSQLAAEASAQQKILDAAVEKARTDLKLPKEAVFDYQKYTFTIPPKVVDTKPTPPATSARPKPASFEMASNQ